MLPCLRHQVLLQLYGTLYLRRREISFTTLSKFSILLPTSYFLIMADRFSFL